MCKTFRVQWGNKLSFQKSTLKSGNKNICHFQALVIIMGFPGGSDGKESTCNAGDTGLIPGSGRFPEEGNSYPLQYSYLGNAMDRGAWWPRVHGVTKELDTT